MKLLITTLAMIFMSFGALSDQKSKYFAQNCLKELFRKKDQTKNKIDKSSIRYFNLVDLNKDRLDMPKDLPPHNCLTDSFKLEFIQKQCNASFGMCMVFDVQKPWGEMNKEFIKCYMDRDGEVIISTQLSTKGRSPKGICSYF